ncbi:hypothetical protein CMI37_02335 [Candidatus Pacearchaeota archaeon]|nr:hypothetical protein [Candidatus Pacearchaeota archaeon]|tara:strand:+ start:154 stop:651 length:498 start_codon:yes stop_codon:yes gene_type:complete
MAPISTFVKNFRDGEITLEDGTTPTALDLTVQYEGGDFSISGLGDGQKEVATYLDRGSLCSIRHTNQTFPTISFSAHLTDLSDGTSETLPDIIRRTTGSPFAAAVSTYHADADVYTLKVTWTITEPGGGTHKVIADDVHLTIDMSEGDPSSFNLSGTVFGSVALT